MSNVRDSPETQQFFIRIRGRVLGPFTVEKLKSLKSRGQFSRIHEISTDRETWQPATELDVLLGSGLMHSPTTATTPKLEDYAAASRPTEPPKESPPAATPGANWFYNIGGEQHGPVSIMELRTMVNTGKLHTNDFLWKEGTPDWLPVSNIPELRPAPSEPHSSTHAVSAGQMAPMGDGIHHTSGLAIASLVMGILGMPLACVPLIGTVFNLLAVIFGATALNAIGKSRVTLGGRGLALSGLILGILGLALVGLWLLYVFGVFASMGFAAHDARGRG